MDRELSNNLQRKNRLRSGLTILLVLVGIALAFYLFRYSLKTSLEQSGVRTAKAETGMVENTLTASGEVIPQFEQVITSPIRAEIQKVLQSVGSTVKPGQPILELDKEFALIELEQLKDELALKQNSMVQLDMQLKKKLSDLQISNDIKNLRISGMQAELEDAKRLESIGGGTQETVERIELDLKIAALEKRQLENDLNFQQGSMGSSLRELELQAAIQQKAVREFERKLDRAEVVATRAGVLTWANENIGTTVSEGESLARIADLGSFRVEGSISDLYADRIKVGQPVKVRINETDLRGQITNIRPTVEDGTLRFGIQLDEQQHELLRPNLKVDVFIVTTFRQDVVRVSNGPAFTGHPRQQLFVLEDGIARRREVSVGLSSFDYVEITDGLTPGETVILSDLSRYEHLKEISLK